MLHRDAPVCNLPLTHPLPLVSLFTLCNLPLTHPLPVVSLFTLCNLLPPLLFFTFTIVTKP